MFAGIDAQVAPGIVVVNKCDLADPMVLGRIERREKHMVLVSARTGAGLPELLQVLEDEVPHSDTLVSVLLL